LKPLRALAFLLLLLPAAPRLQGKAKKPDVLPAVFNHAQYVYVQAVDGDEFNPRVYPDDLQAIANVESALRDWKRYTLALRPEDADLIIVVRKGRLAEANVGVRVNAGSQRAPASQTPGTSGSGVAVEAGGEVGPRDDLFEVYVPNPSGIVGAPLWMRTLADGLNGSKPPLFEQLKKAVEHDYPTQTPSQRQKP
jgi:hypothetical protein